MEVSSFIGLRENGFSQSGCYAHAFVEIRCVGWWVRWCELVSMHVFDGVEDRHHEIARARGRSEGVIAAVVDHLESDCADEIWSK